MGWLTIGSVLGSVHPAAAPPPSQGNGASPFNRIHLRSPALAQDLAAMLRVDPAVGLSGDIEDCTARGAAFGTNRLTARKDISFAELLLEALNVRTRLNAG